MSLVLVIYDNETAYANSLLDYITRSMKLHVNVHAFSNLNKFKEYIYSNMVGLLLVSEKVNLAEVNHSNIKNICILWEGETEDSNFTYPCIYKYQSAKGIMEQIIKKYPIITNTRQEIKEEQKYSIISVISLDHKKLQSEYAYQLAKEYSKYKKVLYINLHCWQLITSVYQLEHNIGVSEFIYYERQKSPNIAMKLKQVIKKVDNLYYLCGTSSGFEISELKVEDIKLWMEQFKLWNEYEIILFDVGNIQPYVMELLSSSNRIIYTLVEEKDKLEQEYFLRQLDYTGHKIIGENMISYSISGNIRLAVEQYIHKNGGSNISKYEGIK